MIKDIFKDKGGKVKKLIIFFLITIFIFLIPLGIYASENLTNSENNLPSESSGEEIVKDILIEEPIIETPNEVVEEIPEETGVSETIIEVIENTTEEPNLEGDVLANETTIEEVINETETANNITEESILEENIFSNETIVNETTINETNIIPIENQTIIIEEEKENILPIQTLTSLSIQISYPEKITRGEIVNINATITNSGNEKINGILLNWIIPTYVSIISEENTKTISLDVGENYVYSIMIETSSLTSLGINEIKLRVNY